jgi:pimeloyl-ACP methyl ester carboxylesterase
MSTAPERFISLKALEAHLRLVHAPFGPLTDAQWAHMARFSARPVADQTGAGGFAMHYDPKIIEPLRVSVPIDVDMWPLWERIHIPRLAIRGAQSDLLNEPVYRRMLESGAEGYVVEDAGHAPALMDYESMARVKAFLLAGRQTM